MLDKKQVPEMVLTAATWAIYPRLQISPSGFRGRNQRPVRPRIIPSSSPEAANKARAKTRQPKPYNGELPWPG